MPSESCAGVVIALLQRESLFGNSDEQPLRADAGLRNTQTRHDAAEAARKSAADRRRMTIALSSMPLPARLMFVLAAAVPLPALAALDAVADPWVPWIIIGAIVLFVAGILVRMILAARFPQGYRQWAASRRESFEARNENWDRTDEEFRR